MPATQHSKVLRALCHEHHVEMTVDGTVATPRSSTPQATSYVCPEPGCGVRYSPSEGYFIAAENGQINREMMPRVKCLSDRQPMYLAQTDPEKRSFRLWKCPECDSTRTNEEGLVAELP